MTEDPPVTPHPAPSGPELPAAAAADSQAPTEPPPPATASAVSPLLRGVVAGLAGGVVAGLLIAAGLDAAWPELRDRLLAPTDRRLTILERAIDDLNPRLSTVEREQSRLGLSTDATAATQTLSQRLAALETRAGSADPRVGATVEQVNRLAGEVEALRRAMPPEGTILRLADRAEVAEKELRELATRRQSAEALLLVVGQLREAVNRGDPYEVELRAARRVAPADDAATLDVLAAGAATGVARGNALIAAFPAVAKDILRAAIAPPDGDFWQRTLNKASSLVSLRRIDGQGDGTAAVVARAEARVKEGDLAKGLQELAALQGDPAQIAAAWMTSAAARVATDRALSELAATAAADTSKRGG